MDRKEDVQDNIVCELGVASVETQGQEIGIPEDQGRVLGMGMSDD